MPHIRRYERADLDRMMALDQVCFTAEFVFDRQSMRRFAEARNAVTFVAETDDDTPVLAGFVIVHIELRDRVKRGYVVTLDVAPDYWRTGIAGSLMETVEDIAMAAGAAQIDLHVSVQNESAVSFYEKQGYQRVGLQEEFYGAPGMDAYVYQKLLHIRIPD